MEKNDISWTVEKAVSFIDKGRVLFDHPMQRESDQWDDDQKSLLIHSILAGYPIPSIYAVVEIEKSEKKFSILDGLQRLTTVNSYLKNGFKLLDEPEVTINGTIFDVSGLSYEELPQFIKDALGEAELLICILSDCSDEDAEEVLIRLNNGTPFSKDQKTKNKLGSQLCGFIDEVSELEFFKSKAYFLPQQLKKAEDKTCVLQSMMLLNGYHFKSFNNKDMGDFAEYYKLNFTDDQLKDVVDTFNSLNNIFKERHKLIKKINIPIFAITLKTAQDNNIPIDMFSEWANNFIEEYTQECEYHIYCGGSGSSTSKTKIKKRIELAYSSLLDFVARKEEQL